MEDLRVIELDAWPYTALSYTTKAYPGRAETLERIPPPISKKNFELDLLFFLVVYVSYIKP